MSLVLLGTFAAAFYTAILGAIWPARDGVTFSEILLDLIAKSLWLSWLVVATSYWMNLPDLLPVLVPVVTVAIIVQLWAGKRRLVIDRLILHIIVVASLIVVCVYLFDGGFSSDYRLIFTTGDALASWNRWAIELSQNWYAPWKGPYPILLPGLWSLVYKAQGDASVWIFAKATLFVIPVILALLIVLLTSYRLYVSAALLGAFVFQFFFVSNARAMLIGDMDIPVCAMMLAAGTSMYVAAQRLAEDDRRAAQSMMFLAAVFVGLASITKQQGIVMTIPLGILVGTAIQHKQLNSLAGLTVACVALIPTMTFWLIYLSVQPEPFGIVPYLVNLSATKSAHGGIITGAFDYILYMIPKAALGLIVILACFNIANIRRLTGQLGITFVGLGICAFFTYAKCCSYDARNGWWVLILFVLAALFGLARAETNQTRSLSAAIPAMLAVIVSIVGAATANKLVTDDSVRDTQEALQWKVSAPQLGQLIKNNLQLFGPGDRLLSQYSPAQSMRVLRERISPCGGRDTRCIEKTIASARRIFVLIRPEDLDYPDLRPHLTLNRLIGDADGFQLYGPIETASTSSEARETSVLEEAQRGTPLRVTFDDDACKQLDFGNLRCGVPYDARYESTTNTWTVASREGITHSYDNAPRRPGHISIWGMVGVFDRAGTLIAGDGTTVGTVALQLGP